jgi:hypothetical protein
MQTQISQNDEPFWKQRSYAREINEACGGKLSLAPNRQRK